MKCRQCGNNVRVNFGGHCSTSCRDFKPRVKKRFKVIAEDDNVVFVDASNEDVIPLHFKKRPDIVREFKEALGE